MNQLISVSRPAKRWHADIKDRDYPVVRKFMPHGTATGAAGSLQLMLIFKN